MSVTINAKGTSTSSFKVGKDGTIITQGGVISPPAATNLKIDLDVDQYMVVDAGTSGPALITASNDQDLHINPAIGGGQYLILNSSRWPTTTGTTDQVLSTNGSGILSWTTVSGTGTVTSVALSSSDGVTFTGSPITSSGTIDINLGNITPDSVAATGTVTGSNLSGSNTGDQTITLTGDVTGSGTGSFATTLASVGTPVSASFSKITTDSKGRVSATTAVTSSDITSALTYTPVNIAGDTMTGQLVLNADPGSSLAAATKQYVDTEVAAVASGINVHAACETATTAALAACTYNNGSSGVNATLTCDTNITLGTIGGYAGLNTTSRLLVKNQSTTLQNGIYTVTSLGEVGVSPWILTRATDFDGSPTSEVQAGDMTYVQEGTLGGTQWVQTSVGTGSPGDYIIVGTNPIVFSQFAGAGTYTAGTGINITDTVISNIGVTSAVAGSNISVSSATGAVTFSVTGTVPSATTATNNVLKAGDTMTGSLEIIDTANTQIGLAVTNSSSGAAASADLAVINNTGKSLIIEVTSSTYAGGYSNQGWIYTSSIPLHFTTGGTAQLSINTSGAIGVSGANYGTTGQVLTSQGSSSAAQWTTPSTAGAPTIVIVSGTSQSATNGNQYVLTNTSAATTVTLPASPTDGDIIWITNVTSRTDHVIARNGKILQGLTEDMTINVANVNIQLRFINTTIGWRIL